MMTGRGGELPTSPSKRRWGSQAPITSKGTSRCPSPYASLTSTAWRGLTLSPPRVLLSSATSTPARMIPGWVLLSNSVLGPRVAVPAPISLLLGTQSRVGGLSWEFMTTMLSLAQQYDIHGEWLPSWKCTSPTLPLAPTSTSSFTSALQV